MRRDQFQRLLPWALFAALMTGCSSIGQGEITQWTQEQRNQAKPRVTPVSEPKPYVPLPYTEAAKGDPFSPERLIKVWISDRTDGACRDLMEKERTRRKEPLEAHPLDAMTMVGSLDRAGKRVALVRVDKLLYQVQVGNYLGQAYGLVTKLSENQVTLREIDEAGTGECIEREATLQLQENAK
jgi:type IV pilus assembly protein PilP